MSSLEPLRNSQRDFSSSVTLKYIMLQSLGLRANTRGVNEVVLRRIAVIKSSVVFNLQIARSRLVLCARKESPASEADFKRVENYPLFWTWYKD